jgi:hypothetical protein
MILLELLMNSKNFVLSTTFKQSVFKSELGTFRRRWVRRAT